MHHKTPVTPKKDTKRYDVQRICGHFRLVDRLNTPYSNASHAKMGHHMTETTKTVGKVMKCVLLRLSRMHKLTEKMDNL